MKRILGVLTIGAMSVIAAPGLAAAPAAPAAKKAAPAAPAAKKAAPAAKKQPRSCGGRRFILRLPDVKGKVYNGLRAVSPRPVRIAYYSGYSTKNVHRAHRELLKKNPLVGDNGKLKTWWKGFAIVDYKEGALVPSFLISRAIRKKMKKWPTAVFLTDKGQCLTRSGKSSKCPGKVRRPYFKSNKGYAVVTYKGWILKMFIGKSITAAKYVAFVTKVVTLASQGKSYCEIKAAMGL